MNKEMRGDSLPERIDEMFDEIDSRIVIALQESDEDYAALVRETDELNRRFPKIEQWLEGDGALTLTAEEHAGLARHTALTAETEDTERRAIYYAGHKDCLAWLRKIEAL
jgi:hypothetical protein